MTLADIEERLDLKEMLALHDDFAKLYDDELEVLSPALLIQAMLGGK